MIPGLYLYKGLSHWIHSERFIPLLSQPFFTDSHLTSEMNPSSTMMGGSSLSHHQGHKGQRPVTQKNTSTQYKSCKHWSCSYMKNGHNLACHDWYPVIVSCEKYWPNWIVRIRIVAKRIFPRFQFWALKSFVKWILKAGIADPWLAIGHFWVALIYTNHTLKIMYHNSC